MSVDKTLFDTALAAEGVSGKLADLARSVYHQESGGGKNTKTSNAGARGGMQITPGTFAGVADKGWSIDDPLQNARAGIRELVRLNKLAGGDLGLTAVGYYGGAGGMEKARKGVAVSDPRNPNAPNTLQYRDQVLARMGEDMPRAVAQAAPAPSQASAAPAVVAQAPVAPPVIQAAPAQEAPPAVAQTPEGQNAWVEFLRSMPQPQGQQVAAEDLSFGSPVVQAAFGAPVRLGPRTPNFQAFSSWKGRAA